MVESGERREEEELLSLLIQMLISPKNILTDIPILFDQKSGPLVVKLTI